MNLLILHVRKKPANLCVRARTQVSRTIASLERGVQDLYPVHRGEKN